MNRPTKEVWTLTITPLNSDVPTAIRIRRLLKFALRALGLRCVAVHGEQREVTSLTTSKQTR